MDKDKPVTIKLKKVSSAPKASIPGNWKESEAMSKCEPRSRVQMDIWVKGLL